MNAAGPGSGLPAASRLIVIAMLVGMAVTLAVTLTHRSGRRSPIFGATFPRSGLVTNEFAYYNAGSQYAVHSSQWVVTSGSLFARSGGGWTGPPDGRTPGPKSTAATDSAVFRLRTRRADFGNVRVSFMLRIDRILTTSRTPAQAYDGVHVWLHYQTPDWLYFASVSRRDGSLVIGKKLPTSAGGRYTDLVRVGEHAFPLRKWVRVAVTITAGAQAVDIGVAMNGRVVAHARDDGTRGHPILRPGRVGIRGDNADFQFRDFEVSSA
jgi:hypothetical protein